MTAVMLTRTLRARQIAALAVSATRVVAWPPMAAAAIGASAVVAIGGPAGVPFRLSLAGACLAASAAYVIDDPAAATVAAAPIGQPTRRGVRAIAAGIGTGIGWTAALVVAGWRVSDLPVWAATAQFLTLLVVALAAASVAAAIGEGTDGALAGVVITMACYASTFLPARPWLPFPPDPAATGATRRLLLIAVAAGAVVAIASKDPAAIRPPRLGRPRGGR